VDHFRPWLADMSQSEDGSRSLPALRGVRLCFRRFAVSDSVFGASRCQTRRFAVSDSSALRGVRLLFGASRCQTLFGASRCQTLFFVFESCLGASRCQTLFFVFDSRCLGVESGVSSVVRR
jgi:hypothetical protein